MKIKKNFIWILFIVILIIGIVVYFQKNLEQQKPKEELTQSFLEQKIECSKIEIPNDLNNYGEVFYSPVKDTCIIAGSRVENRPEGALYRYAIFDYFKQSLLSDYFLYLDTSIKSYKEVNEIYDNVRSYLRGEEELKYTINETNFVYKTLNL
ncbi:MAG: hypothetical protein WC909_02080 [Candidatus Paceibacterota bacterium]|jgi:hypothetical protein